MQMVTSVILATSNPHKIKEFRELFRNGRFEIVAPARVGLALNVPETGATYHDNALLKARAYATAGGMLALADDSGIEVDALGGGPGIYSARFGGESLTDEQRVQLLLDRLAGAPAGNRAARYRCALVLANAAGEMLTVEGTCEGSIAAAPRGVNGFGYDPVFILDGEQRTMAELSSAEKHRVSHRGLAAAALSAAWDDFGMRAR
jgi:XTP/dITP diphosphohydrolase